MEYYVDGNKVPSENGLKPKKSAIREIYEWIDAVIASVIIIVLLFTFVFRIVGIQGESMENTLYNGDRVVISNLFYTPSCGDIVVISRNYKNVSADTEPDDSPIIKRVIATEGQTVTIDSSTGEVFVDGDLLNETYVKPDQVTTWNVGNDTIQSTVVEKGKIFVMGDNRGNSLDSRSEVIGQVDVRYVLGKAFLRIYPFDSFGGL